MTKNRKRKTNLPPGSVIFTGEQKLEDSSITIVQYNSEEVVQIPPKAENLPIPKSDQTLWIDVRGLHDIELISQIGGAYSIHSLALEDVADVFQRPKIDEYKNGILLIVKALYVDNQTKEIKPEQISIFQSENFVISFQENKDDIFDIIKKRLNLQNGKVRGKRADYLSYALIDVVVDRYYLILDHIDSKIEELEDEITTNPDSKTKEKLHHLKREITHLRKYISPMRDAVGKWFRIDNSYIDESTHMYLRDLYDHLNQVLESIDTYRDMLSGLQDLYLSEISFRMNNVMQVLTIIATIFIPLTFLAGIYGMNFKFIPELEWKYSYFVLWIIMIIITLFLIRFFRKKDWL
jgi:magnesium transporter